MRVERFTVYRPFRQAARDKTFQGSCKRDIPLLKMQGTDSKENCERKRLIRKAIQGMKTLKRNCQGQRPFWKTKHDTDKFFKSLTLKKCSEKTKVGRKKVPFVRYWPKALAFMLF
jgi:hypothetical protein